MGTPFVRLSAVLPVLPVLLLRWSAVAMTGGALLGTMPTLAQSYPTKPIRLIVPYPPGGTTDFVAREVGNKVGELLGAQIVIDNRPGAGTLIGLALGVKAAPDGYTITFGTSAGLAVNPALPVRSVKDLIELAKAQPGKLNFASPGFDCNSWYGLLAPTGTPPAIVAKFNAELNRALANPGVIQRLRDQGVEATPGTSAAFRELIVAETERWRMVIKSAGITADAAQ